MATCNSYFNHKSLLITTAAVLFLTPLVPEYIALPFTLLLFLWFKPQAKKNGEKVLMGETGKALFFFMCYQLLTVLWAGHKIYTAAIAMMWLGTFLAYCMLANGIKSQRVLDKFIFGAALSDGVMGLLCVFQSLFYGAAEKTPVTVLGETIKLNEIVNPFWRILDSAVFKILPIEFLPYEDPSRATATFNNPLVYAAVAVLLLPLALYCAYTMKKWYRAAAILSAALSVAGVVLSKSRACCIVLGVMLCLTILYGLKKSAAVWLCSLPLLIAFAGRYLEPFLNSFVGDYSTNTRIEIWTASLEIAKEKWLFGLGAGVQNVWDVLLGTYGINQPHSHNILLEFLLEGGIFGLLLFLAFGGMFLYRMVKLCFLSQKGRMLAVSFALAIGGFCGCGMTDFVLMTPKELLSFMMVLGLAEAAYRILKRDEETYIPVTPFPETEPEKELVHA